MSKLLCLVAPVCALSVLLAVGARADIYERVDRSGVAHYSNTPRGPGWRKLIDTPRNRSQGMRRAARDRSPERFERYDGHIQEASQLYRLPEAFIRAVMHVESDFDPQVVSVDGAMGLMQLMPGTARKMGVTDPFDPRQNILGGSRFLRVLANRFNGDLVLTVAAYNAGGGAVERYGGVPPYRETRRYVNKVLDRYYGYKARR